MTREHPRLLIVGAGMAAGRLLERLVARGYPGRITLTGAEPLAGYNRVLLPSLVAGTVAEDALRGPTDDWFERHGIRTVLGTPAVHVDVGAQRVLLGDGTRLDFDRLVLATGASVPVPDIPGRGLRGVTTLRTLGDARRLRTLARCGPAVVVGGGLLGLETAQSLLDLGTRVHVVHRRPRLMNRQLDETGAGILAAALTRRGLKLILGATPVALAGDARVSAVTLCTGETLPAATVVFATGARANDGLAAGAGIECRNGVIVDAAMRTSHPAVFAIGECASAGGSVHALVEPVFRQADVLARILTGESAAFRAPAPATRLKVSGIELFSAGEVSGGNVPDGVCIRDRRRGLYRHLTFHEQRLVGAVLLGDISGSRQIQSLIDDGAPIDAGGEGRARIAFGLARAARGT